jgi:hypothetical protein
MLIAAHGSLPLDFRTSPPAVDFTSSETIEAIRDALDLAKEGLITYVPFSKTFRASVDPSRPSSPAIEMITYHPMEMEALEGREVATFPRGSRYAPGVYLPTVAFISPEAANPEACYRLIAAVSERPHLLAGTIPARLSSLEDPVFIASQGEDRIDTYLSLLAQVEAPESVSLQLVLHDVLPEYYPQVWLYWAFDRYALGGANLETELAEAERMALEYGDCITGIEERYARDRYRECALAVDPAVGEKLPWFISYN